MISGDVPTLFDDPEGKKKINLIGRIWGKTHAIVVARMYLIEDGSYSIADHIIRITSDTYGRKIWQVRSERGLWIKVFQIQPRGDVTEFLQLGRTEVADEIYKQASSLYDAQVLGRILYAQRTESCSNCGRKLTDKRSMHYAIGPDCEKDHPDVIAEIDAIHNGKSWEDLNVHQPHSKSNR